MHNQKKTKTWDYIGLWALFWHLVVTTVMGTLMPEGRQLAAAHQLVLPLTDLIPNVKRYAEKSIDPIFAETFIGYSLVIAVVFLVVVMLRMPAKQGKVFFKRWQRFRVVLGFTACCLGMICILWLGPINPASKGRAYFMIQAATSSYAGIVMVMNSLLVSMPFCCLVGAFIGFRGTSTHINHA